MSIASEIEDLRTNLQSINETIVAKGGEASTSGLSGMSTAIEEIPGGGSTPTSYGKIWYYTQRETGRIFSPNQSSGVVCTAYDWKTLEQYFTQLGVSVPDMIIYDPNTQHFLGNGQDDLGDATTLAQHGLSLTVVPYNEGGMPEEGLSIYLDSNQYMPVKSSLVCAEINSLADYQALSTNPARQDIVVNGITTYRNLIKEFEFGTVPTSVPNNFLAGCRLLDRVDTSHWSVTTIGNLFLNGCSLIDPEIDLSNVTSIGSSFLGGTNFNHSVDFSNVDSIGTNLLSEAKLFNQPLNTFKAGVVANTTAWLTYCFSFNSAIDISKFDTLGDYFMAYCPSFNQNLTFSPTISQINGYVGFGFDNFTANINVGEANVPYRQYGYDDTFCSMSEQKPIYTQGFTISGNNAEAWAMEALPTLEGGSYYTFRTTRVA